MEDLVRKDLPPICQQRNIKDEGHHVDLNLKQDRHVDLSDSETQITDPESQKSRTGSISQDDGNCEIADQNESEMSERLRPQADNDEKHHNTQGDNEENVQGCFACKDICLEDFEMAELSDSHNEELLDSYNEKLFDSHKEELLDSQNVEIRNYSDSSAQETHQVSEYLSCLEENQADCDGKSPKNGDLFTQDRSPSPLPNVLRHRLEPEPPRSEHSESTKEDTKPKSSKELRKLSEIQRALDSDPVDIESLRRLAISPGGLVNKQMRQQVWPLLINVNTKNIPPKPEQEEMEAMTKTYNQVVMDVNRSSSRFPPGIDDHVRMSLKDKLVDLIMRVMLHHKGQLKYYQGFHDVCVTFLLCMDEDLSFAMVNKLAIGYMREYLDETMERTSLLLSYIYPLVNRCNPELCEHMQRNDLGTIFALSWVITWFSHVLGDIKRILRVFDFFLASHRMMPVYLSAAFVLHRERDIFDAGDEMGYIHKCLSVIPPDLPLESLLERAGDLYLQYPPTEISQDPMLISLNNQVYEHFNLIERRNARRLAQQQEASNHGNRLFVRFTLWTVTAVVGVAVAVLYHTYYAEQWTGIDVWNSS